jgi:Fic family protein
MVVIPPALTDADHRAVGRVDEMRQRLRYHVAEPKRWSGLLRRVALARAIRGSNSIEGFDVSLDDAFSALDEQEPLGAKDAAWAAVTGYRDAMTYVLNLAQDEDFRYDESLIRGLHFMMQSYDLTKWPGRYRKADIFVVDEDNDRTVYVGPDALVVPGLMTELVEWLNHGDGDCPAILRAAMAHLNLAMIHPFKDGNGRMARVLQTLVLAREGVLAPEFCSIEEYLGRNEQDYYDVLLEVGKGAWQPHLDATAWLRFCLTAHFRQALRVLGRVEESERFWLIAEKEITSRKMPERMIAPLFHTMSGRYLRNSTYRQIEPEISPNLASRDLQDMVQSGILQPRGEKRGRYYLPVERLQQRHHVIKKDVRSRINMSSTPYDEDVGAA